MDILRAAERPIVHMSEVATNILWGAYQVTLKANTVTPLPRVVQSTKSTLVAFRLILAHTGVPTDPLLLEQRFIIDI